MARNLWAFTIIFCGHFPDGVAQFTEDEADGESRGHWYLRQLLGSANLTGGRLFHLLTGNLSHQIEHHLFPDLPAHRYAEIAPEVRERLRALRPALQPGRARPAVRVGGRPHRPLRPAWRARRQARRGARGWWGVSGRYLA